MMRLETASFRFFAATVMSLLIASAAWPQGPVLFQDTFGDGDPSDWQIFAGGWSESGGLRLARNTSANQPVASVWPLGYEWSDYAVEADIRILDARSVSQASLVFRFNTPFPNNDYCRCGFLDGRPGVPGLPSGKYLRMDCPGTDSATPFNFVVGQFYRLRATAIGRTTTCEVIGFPNIPRLISTSDALSCTGTAGLRSTHIRSDFDNFLVIGIPAEADPSCLETPIADAGPDQILAAGATCSALATLDGSGSIAPEGDELLYDWSSPFGSASGPFPQYSLPLGNHLFTLTVTDGDGDADSDTTMATVIDTTAPELHSIEAQPAALWPPNHKMVSVQLTAFGSDNCDPGLTCDIVRVESNEPIDGQGDGNTEPDWEIIGPLQVDLRAERSGGGGARIYTLHLECSDSSGNAATDSTEVRVEHDRGRDQYSG